MFIFLLTALINIINARIKLKKNIITSNLKKKKKTSKWIDVVKRWSTIYIIYINNVKIEDIGRAKERPINKIFYLL